MKLISTHERNNKLAKVYEDAEQEEYLVKFFSSNHEIDNKEFHTRCLTTSCLEEALTAARNYVEE